MGWRQCAFTTLSGDVPASRTSSPLQCKPLLVKIWNFHLLPSSHSNKARRCASKWALKMSPCGPWVATKRTWPTVHRNRAAAGRHRLCCQAISLPETVDATIRNIISISAVMGISYGVLLAAVSEPPQPPVSASRTLPPAATPGTGRVKNAGGVTGGDDDNFVWGLMGFISILPLFDWLAWVLAAISDEDRAALYGIYAALYGSPLLLRGLNWQDPWVLFMVALCVVHVQVERIAQTEPETLRSIRPVAAVGAALRGAVRGTGTLLSGIGGVLAEDSRRAVRRPGGRSTGGIARTELGTGEERLQLGQDPNLVDSESGRVVDPRRDLSRDPELEDFAARELRLFDEQLKRAEEQQLGRKKREGRGRGDAAGAEAGTGAHRE
ncbi:hypothetical protein VaNZ11_001505 [Volvox africanus]|uniref:Uncharacterized protein n=1 Tax=Volvox africanus TaxID=51714 RepID=A0ABQ5RPT5_9CHLO|nr:hypothetical protein VaNZ11_001505 [Volvox africanus]